MSGGNNRQRYRVEWSRGFYVSVCALLSHNLLALWHRRLYLRANLFVAGNVTGIFFNSYGSDYCDGFGYGYGHSSGSFYGNRFNLGAGREDG